MGLTGSVSILWMQYIALACIVLTTGYMAFRWLPSVLRWGLVGLVAGMILLPWPFTEGATATEAGFSGWAPAIIVSVINVLHHHLISSAFLGMAAAGAVGALVGMMFGKRVQARGNSEPRPSKAAELSAPAAAAHKGRKEPSL